MAIDRSTPGFDQEIAQALLTPPNAQEAAVEDDTLYRFAEDGQQVK